MSTVEENAPDTPAEGAVPSPPSIEVVGAATPEQVAALVAVLSGLGGEDEPAAGPPSRWASRDRLVGAPLHPAPGAWRASAFPR